MNSAKLKRNTLVNFSLPESFRDWKIVTDGVMGGISQAWLTYIEGSHLVFRGEISTENNGGFASFRSPYGEYDFSDYDGLGLNIKTDDNTYRLSLRDTYKRRAPSYNHYFSTSGEWQTLLFPFSSFRHENTKQEPVSRETITPEKIKQFYFMHYPGKEGIFQIDLKSLFLYRYS